MADPLALALRNRGFAVWIDHDTLSTAARAETDFLALHHEIEKGLTDCHAGIVILSRHYIRKDWPTRELESLLSIDTLDGRLRLIPVLHGIQEVDLTVSMYDRLRPRLTISTDSGFEQVCDEVLRALTASATVPHQPDDGPWEADLPSIPRGLARCTNASCSWQLPPDFPFDFPDPGPEFMLARIESKWCIVCQACRHPVGWLTPEEARILATKALVGGTSKRTRLVGKETAK